MTYLDVSSDYEELLHQEYGKFLDQCKSRKFMNQETDPLLSQLQKFVYLGSEQIPLAISGFFFSIAKTISKTEIKFTVMGV